MFLGGVDPGLVLLSKPWASSFDRGVAAAAISVVASVGRADLVAGPSLSSGRGSCSRGLLFPPPFLTLRMLLLDGRPAVKLTEAALWLLDSSPFGVGLSLLGVMPRPSSIIERVLRMMGMLETARRVPRCSTLWAAWAPAPGLASALEDVEGQRARLRMLRQWRRRRPRPPCGNDPVLWNATQTNRRATVGARIEDRLIFLVWIGLIALVTSWFAVPAFRELAARGYGAAPEAFTMPAWNPLVRVLGDNLIMPAGGPAAGQARLEFNIALRQFSAFWALGLRPRTLLGRLRGREGGAGAAAPGSALIATPALRVGDPPGQDARARPESPSRHLYTDRALWTVGLDGRAPCTPGLPGQRSRGWRRLPGSVRALGVSRSLREGGMKRAGHPLALVVRLRGRGRGDHVGGGVISECSRLVVAALVRGCFLRGSTRGAFVQALRALRPSRRWWDS